MKNLSMIALSAALLFSATARAQEAVEQVEPLEPAATADLGSLEDAPVAWFVELQGAPSEDGGSLAALQAEKKAFRDAARKAGVQVKERFSYDKLWNGLSVEVSSAGLAKLTRLPQVKAVYPVFSASLPPVEPVQPGDEPNMGTAVAMTQSDIAGSVLGLTGQGIRVAVMDTGIDFDHPDLGGCFGPGCRVEVGYDFVGDAFNNDTIKTLNPDAIPDDCGGHGSHVAGIVGANGTFKGAAPGVTFGAYRVFGCAGSTTFDIMLAAMERILADGADVLNMSIGSSFQWPNYPTAQGADRLVRRGIVVVASAGNNGANGLFAGGAPGVGHKTISVASVENSHLRAKGFTISPDDKAIAYNQASGSPAIPTSGTGSLARTGTPASAADGCNPLPAGSLAGKVALIRRGTCPFHTKALNAQNAGAVAALLYNNVVGLQSVTVAGTPAITIPVASITAEDGVTINNRLAAGPVDLTWRDMVVYVPNVPNAGLIAGSSSYGMSPDLTLKPDIAAPGASIYSTFPLEIGGFAVLSGTSMASPHVAGAVALLLEARPNTSPAAVRALLQNTAKPIAWWGNPALGFLDNVHRQGAGMLQIADAIRSGAKVEPSKLSLGEVAGGSSVTHTLTVKNDGADAVTYDLSSRAALATGPNTFVPAFFNAPATVTFSAPTLTVPAGGFATVDVTVTAPTNVADKSLFGGYAMLTPQGGGQTLRVPFAGFKGDYQAIQILVPTANNFPWLAKASGTSFTNQPGGATYTMAGNDIPFFVVHFDHQVRAMKVEIIEVGTNKSWHLAFKDEYLPRNSGAATFFSFAWDGITANGSKTFTVPNGQYVAKMTVQKALGTAEDVETWTSPVITIAR